MRAALPLFVAVVLVLHYVDCSNLLTIFDYPSKSHAILGVKLAEGLIKRGHHVTMASPFINEPMENFTQIHLKSILDYRDSQKNKIQSLGTGLKMSVNLIKFSRDIIELFWEDPRIRKIIDEKPQYDVIIAIGVLDDVAFGLAHHLGIPIILFSPIGTTALSNRFVGNPNMPYISNPMIGVFANTFLGRLLTVTLNCFGDVLSDFFISQFQEDIKKKYFPYAPTLRELRRNVSLVLVNSHFSIEPPRPYVPNMIQIGGFHIQDTRELPNDIKCYLDSAKEGAILFSMGSNVLIGIIEKEKLEAIFKVLGEMAPIKVLFKSELDHVNLPKNIMVSKWLPQVDILAHPNIKVFISHGGLGGNTEAVYHGVPILGIPFFGDQKMNLVEAEKAGYAAVVFNEDFTEELFRKKLKKVLENPKYRENAKMRSALLKEQPVKPMDNAAFWIEHVIKYGGGSHLRNAGMDLAWYQFYMVDIYIFYTAFSLLVLLINYYVIKFIFQHTRRIFYGSGLKIKTS